MTRITISAKYGLALLEDGVAGTELLALSGFAEQRDVAVLHVDELGHATSSGRLSGVSARQA